ncbi:MAG TPA: hypothetical protein VFS62_09135, partial [Chloroflexota bacterium]|nr:hypothetical protein [Chloroflexota bacterium]
MADVQYVADGAGPIAVLTPPDVQELPEPEEESRDLIVGATTTTILDAESESGVTTTELPPELRLRGIRGLVKGRITFKIVMPFIVLMFVLAIGGTWYVLNQVTGSLVQRFQNQLLDAGKNANDSIIT